MGHSHENVDLENLILDEDCIMEVAEFFKVFGDKTRVSILLALFGGEMSVGDIAKKLDMQGSAISHQLRILKQAKLIKNRREGKNIYYSLADDHVQTILVQGVSHILE